MPLNKISVLTVLLLILSFFLTSVSASAFDTTWQPIKVGGGGFVTGMDISPTGATRVVRTDTAGAYIWNGTQWQQLITAQTMPASAIGPLGGGGVQEIAIAPSQPTTIYMAYWQYIYISTDSGSTWTQTNFPAQTSGWPSGDGYRTMGQKMAVDPANPNVVYCGTETSGVYVTTDGGNSWTQVSAIPDGTGAGITGIRFDPTSGTTGGMTNTIYISSNGSEVYRSGNAGTTWTNITTTTGPAIGVAHAKMASDGTYYCVAADWNSVWRFSSVWTNITPTDQTSWFTIATDPFNAQRVVVNNGPTIEVSTNRGGTWSGAQSALSCDSTDCPWLAYPVNGWYEVGSDAWLDPVTQNYLWMDTGTGVNYLMVPNTLPSTLTLTDISVGIENLTAVQVISPPGGNPVLSCLDFQGFYVSNPSTFTAQHITEDGSGLQLTAGFSLDYATTNPQFIVGDFQSGS